MMTCIIYDGLPEQHVINLTLRNVTVLRAKKRRHHHPRMLMGLYYPQAVTLKMGPTAVVARSHWLSDFDPAYQSHDVLSTPRQSTAGVNNCGDYLGTGRGGAKDPKSEVPERLGVTRYMAVPAGTFMIMFYDTVRARPGRLG
jgi:hypothetical protein